MAELFLLSSSAGVRRLCGRKMAARKLLRYEGEAPKMEETRDGWQNYCFRQLPYASVDVRGFLWTDDGSWEFFRGKRRGGRPKWQKLGRCGEIIAPLSLRGIPTASVDIREHPRFAWVGAGRWKIVRKKGRRLERQKLGMSGRNIDAVSFRQLPRTSAVCVGGRWKLGNCQGEEGGGGGSLYVRN